MLGAPLVREALRGPVSSVLLDRGGHSTFPSTASCVGIRLEEDDHWRVYAPFGLSDLVSLVVRPNPTLAPRHVCEEKVSRWRRQWPSLRILPWPEVSGTVGDELARAPTAVGDPASQE